jgi:hypothetical protein
MKWIELAAVVFCLLFCLLFTVSASAEFYKYYDKNGNVHFTDDFNKVPPEQRAGVKGYEEILTTDEEKKEQTVAEPQPDANEGGKAQKKSDYDLNSKIKDLDKRKTELAAEYEKLMKENEAVAKMRKEVKTRADAKKYNDTVRALNEKLKEHDKKRKAFYADVEEYNAKVAELNQARDKSEAEKETE